MPFRRRALLTAAGNSHRTATWSCDGRFAWSAFRR